MSIPAQEMKVIPYGLPSLRAEQVKVRVLASGEAIVDCPAPFVTVDCRAGRVLRLNGDQYAFPEPPDLRAMTEASVQLDFLRDHLKHFCDLWARPPKLFLDRYFDFVAARIESHEGPLAEALKRFGSLYSHRDWALSAPRPLPRALLPTMEGGYCPVDFAFWLGDRALAILLAGSGTPTGKDLERRAMLNEADVEILELSVGGLARDGVSYLMDAALPGEFDRFWEDEIMPSSPFKGTSLDEIVRE